MTEPSEKPIDNTAASNSAQDVEAAKEVRAVRGPAARWRWILIVSTVLMSNFLWALDNTVVAVIQAVIVMQFGSINRLTWITVAFAMCAAATVPFWSKACTHFNNKAAFLASFAIFEIGSALCGAVPNMTALICGRAIAGMGGSGMYMGVMAILTHMTTLQERPIYMGAVGITWGLGTVLGPIVGGAFNASAVGWRWAFYINLIIGGVCAPFRLSNFDAVGLILFIGATVSGIMGIAFGGIVYAWNSAQTIALFSCSVVLIVLLVTQQARCLFTTLAARICPVDFLRSRSMVALFVMTAAAGTALFVPNYFIPIFFQFTRQDTALEAGVRLLPYVCVLVSMVLINGIVMSLTGLYWPWYAVGGIITLVGGCLMQSLQEEASSTHIWVLGHHGSWVGCFVEASFSVAQGIIMRKGQPNLVLDVTGFITTAQVLGTTIGLAIANTVFLNRGKILIHNVIPNLPQDQILGTLGGASSESQLTATQQQAVLQRVVEAIQETYWPVVAAAAVVIVASATLRRERVFIV